MHGEDEGAWPWKGWGDPAGAPRAPWGLGELQGDFPCASAARSSTNEPSNWQHGNILCSLSSGKRWVRERRSPARAGAAGSVPGGHRRPKAHRPPAGKRSPRLRAESRDGERGCPGGTETPPVSGGWRWEALVPGVRGGEELGAGAARSGAPCLLGVGANLGSGGFTAAARGGGARAVTARFLLTTVNPTD